MALFLASGVAACSKMMGSRWIVLVAASVCVCTACSSHAPSGAERPIEVVVPTEPQTLDPRFATRSLDVKITRLVHAGLFGLDPTTLEPVPLAAEGSEWKDARTLRVTLKPGVRFHGGGALTPRDVCATIAAVRDPALGSPHRGIVEAIGTCVADGANAVVLTLDHARATLLTDLEIPILRADEARSPPRSDGKLDGLGPFVIASVAPGEVSLSPATTSAMATPRHAVVVRTVRDENARVQRLLSGRSDVAPNAVSPQLLPALDGRSGLRIVSRPGANVTYLMFQNDRAVFRDVAVRRAVAAAIDRDAIVRTLLAGRGTVAKELLPPGHWASGEVGGERERGPEPAGEGGGAVAGRLELRALGTVELLTSTDRARVTMARVVAQMLGDAGLGVRVVTLDQGVMFARLDAGDFDLAVLQMPELTEPNVLSWFFHPRGVPGEGGQGKNRARYRSELAGRLLDDASTLEGRAARRPLYRRLAAVMAADLPVIPLWHEDQVAVVSERARGFLPSAEGRWLSLATLY
ncbi:MAG TPA: ABC transporter substrate-binding protein [Polyangiaceae bacterium]|nr:ABC transporter substrate-binding protein [Polyangiaceae bacterium]